MNKNNAVVQMVWYKNKQFQKAVKDKQTEANRIEQFFY